MLNTELVDSLYDGLSKERKEELITLLFKRSKQTMNYFHRTKDISLSKLEILADFFNMPLDFFRTQGSFKANNVHGSYNSVGNIYLGTNLLLEIESLKKDNIRLQESVEDKKTIIDTYKEQIATYKEQIASYKKQLGIA